MTHYFLDSSALAKRYIPERGTPWVRSIASQGAGNVVIIAQITPIEVVSGLSRRKREGHLLPTHAHIVRRLLDRHATREYVVIVLNGQIAALAKDLLEAHPLRAYDAVQLASALETDARLVSAGLSPLVFVSADKQLMNVAASIGLAVDDPDNHP